MLSFNAVKEAVDVVVRAGRVPNIVGLQGIGKTELVREYALENGFEFAEVTCSLLQEGDLAMPFLNDGNMCYSVNSIIMELAEKCNTSGNWGILLLDELNRAGEKAQSELMNLVLQRRVVNYKLPDCIRIVVAMNPNSTMKGYENTTYSVFDSDSAIMGRVLTLNMKPSIGEWLEYGRRLKENGETMVHPLISSFLSRNSSLFVTKEIEGSVNNTPRGWSIISDVLYSWDSLKKSNSSLLLNLLNGALEEKTAGMLLQFIKENTKGFDYFSYAKQILSSKSTDEWGEVILKMNDAELNRVFKSMCSLCESGLNETYIENICKIVICATPELAYSWVQSLNKDYPDLYTTMLDSNEDFASCALNLMMDVKVTEVGGFNGK